MKCKQKIYYFFSAWSCIIIMIFLTTSLLQSQSGIKGNTFVHASKELVINNAHGFNYGGSGLMPGIVGTTRNPPSYVSFNRKASVTSVSDIAHVDGYVKVYGIPVFTFPIGDNGRYAPVSILADTLPTPINAAYYEGDPNLALTTSLKGGNEMPLPQGAPFATYDMGVGVTFVSPKEYWDVNGDSPVRLTLHWDDVSDIAFITSQMMDALRIVGWNGTKWVDIPATIQPGSTYEAGSITVNEPIIPNQYNVYTFGTSCTLMDVTFIGIPSDLYICKDEEQTISVAAFLPAGLKGNSFILQIFDGEWKDAEQNSTGIFTFDGFPSDEPPRKYRILWQIASGCQAFSGEFTHFPYKSGTLACIGKVNVTLDNDCQVLLTPSMLLAEGYYPGFYDLEIRDASGNLKNNPLGSDDVNGTYMVTVREKCTANSCWSQVFIEDKYKPIVDCGQPQTFSCVQLEMAKSEEATILFQGGPGLSQPPSVKDNCSKVKASFTDRWVQGQCAASVIYRDWLFKDISGNTALCSQELRFEPLDFADLIAPEPEITLSCGQGDAPEEIAILFDDNKTVDNPVTPFTENMEGYGKAFITTMITDINGRTHAQKVAPGLCNLFSYYKDIILPLCNPSCGGSYKIIRTWTVLDDCTNATTTFTQIIKVMDQTGPTFVVTSAKVAINAADCTASYKVPTPQNLKDDCTPMDQITWRLATPPGATQAGTAPNIVINNLGVGLHTLQYIVEDCCGNTSAQSETIEVTNSAPVAYCKPISVMWDDVTPPIKEFWAKDFDIGSTDHCTAQNRLFFTFDGVMPLMDSLGKEHFFTKNASGKTISATYAAYQVGLAYRWQPARRSAGKIFNAPGQYPIQMTVWNEYLLKAECTTWLSITSFGQLIPVSGTIQTEKGLPIENVLVFVKSESNGKTQTALTDQEGKYSFSVPAGDNYTVWANKNDDYLNGVSTLDLVMIQRHILGLQPHDTPYKVIASDGTDNAKISAADLVEIRKLILGAIDTFTNESWRFPVANYTPDIKSPFPFTEQYQLENPLVPMTDIDFVAVKIGDVDGNAMGGITTAVPGKRITPKQSIFGIHKRAVRTGDLVQIPVKATLCKDVIGFQATIKLHKAVYRSLEGNMIDFTAQHIGTHSDSLLTISISMLEGQTYTEGSVLFTLNIIAQKDGWTTDMVEFSSAITPSEAYFGDLSTGVLTLQPISDIAAVELQQNKPNPFIDETTITFIAENQLPVTLTIFDGTGKLMMRKVIETKLGINTVFIGSNELGESGVYFYSLETDGWKETRKMLKVE